MTKEKETKEAKELKRSKSASDIPLPDPQTNYPYTQLVFQAEEITELKKETQAKSETIKLFREREEKLQDKEKLLTEQLKEKQKQIEELRTQLEEKETIIPITPQPTLNEYSELDNSLIARHKNLRDWFTEHSKRKKLEQELEENINEASSELIRQDKLIDKLRDENRKLRFSNQSLTKDLELAYRAVEWRKNPLPNEDKTPWLSPTITLFLIIYFISLLNSSWRKYHFKDKP